MRGAPVAIVAISRFVMVPIGPITNHLPWALVLKRTRKLIYALARKPEILPIAMGAIRVRS